MHTLEHFNKEFVWNGRFTYAAKVRSMRFIVYLALTPIKFGSR